MELIFEGGETGGEVRAPPSKSHSHRALLMAALADGDSLIRDPLRSADIGSTLGALLAMGAEVTEREGDLLIRGRPLRAPGHVIDVGNSGTTLRLLAGIAATLSEEVAISGDASIQGRPMGPLLDALESLGARCRSRGGFPPVHVLGPLRGGSVSIEGGMSSQFVSSLLMASPLAAEGVRVEVVGRMLSRPYVDVTLGMMRRFGVDVGEEGGSFLLGGGGGYKAVDYRVPGDFSSAAFPLAAGALGGGASVCGLDLSDPQGDKAILDILREMGAELRVGPEAVEVARSELRGVDLDMGDIPDLFPIVAVLAATAHGESRLHGAPHLRLKESDRIRQTVLMLQSLGAEVSETLDGCRIRGVPRLRGGVVDPAEDHRLMMAAAVASLVADGPVAIKGPGCHAVSYPSFLEDMGALGLRWRRRP